MRMSASRLGHMPRQPQLAFWQPPSFTCSCHRVKAASRVYVQHSRSSIVVNAAQQASSNDVASGPTLVPLPALSDVKYVEDDYVEVGTISGGFGIKGEVRIDISTDNPKRRFGQSGRRIFLLPPPATGLLARSSNQTGQPMMRLTTVSAKVKMLPKKEEDWIVQFKELSDRSQADQLSGWRCMIPVTEREQLKDPDEFWVQDLVGCRAFLNSDSSYVGRVIDVISGTGTYDTLVLQLAVNKDDIINSRTRQCMVPFVKAMVPYVDQSLKQVAIDPPEGLLTMFSYNPLKKKLSEQQKADKMAALAKFVPPVFGQASESEGESIVAAEAPSAPPGGKTAKTQAAGKSAKQERSTSSTGLKGGAAAAATGAKKAKAPEPEAMQEEEEEEEWVDEEGDGGEEVGSGGSSQDNDQAAALQRWKLRRKLGVSLGARQRKVGR